jgi:hypothetical protein
MLWLDTSMEGQPDADLHTVPNQKESMLWLDTRKGQPDADLQPIHKTKHAPVNNMQE